MTSEDINLIEKYLSETLSTDEKEMLISKLESSEIFRNEFNEAKSLKGLIYSSMNDKPLVIEVMSRIQDKDKDLENRIMGQLKKKKGSTFALIFKAAAAAAIAFFIVTFSLKQVQTAAALLDKSDETVIRRADSRNKDFSKLYVNDIVETGSVSEKITFDDGTKLKLELKSKLKVVSENPKIFKLSKGGISAEVSPQDKPMIIETSSATVEVLGTIFNLKSQEKNSLLKVEKGRVAITDKITGERAEVTAGEYTLAEGKALKVRKGKGPLFVSDAIDKHSNKRYLDIEVNLEGEKQLTLICTNSEGSNNDNKTAWLNPVVNINGIWTSLTKLKPKFIKVSKAPFKSYITTEETDQLKVHGKSYVRGIYAHSTSILIWDLPKGSKMIKCRAAILDAELESNKDFSAKFEVYSEISQEMLEDYLNEVREP